MQETKSEILELLSRNDLLRAALIVGKISDPGFVEGKYRERIMEIAARIWNLTARAKYDPIFKVNIINQVVFKELGIEGKGGNYKKVIDDPRQFYLHHLLERKIGSPLATTIFYKILADQVGLTCSCYTLPTHYYLKVEDVVAEFYVDPFDRGRMLTTEEFQRKVRQSIKKNTSFSVSLFERVDYHQLVGRLVQRLKQIYILKGKALEALRAVELLTAIYPQSPEFTRDRGILYCEVEYFSKAMEDLRYYLKKKPNAEDVKEIKKLTTMLQGYQEIIN